MTILLFYITPTFEIRVCVLMCEAVTTYSPFCLCLSSTSWLLPCSIWQPFPSVYPPSLTALTRCLYLFPVADVRNHHKLMASSNTNVLQAVLEVRRPEVKVLAALCPCWRLQESLCCLASMGSCLKRPLLHGQGQQSSIFKSRILWPLLPALHLLLGLSRFHSPWKDGSNYILSLW